MRLRGEQSGFTLVELAAGIVIMSMVIVAMFSLFTSLVSSAVLAKHKAVALSLTTNQMEYLKSLPYDSLAVSGGSIYATNPLPASKTVTLNGIVYTVKTDIGFVDDAFDGCGAYPDQALKQKLCRNYPPPSGAPATDLNDGDYKVVHVAAYDKHNLKLAEVDTQVSARVAETASTTGALFVSVIDSNGNPVQGATAHVTNATIAPAADLSDTTDSGGIAIFYKLPPDTNAFDYVISASKAGYSTLSTIAPSGTLVPSYPNQKVFTQLSSYVTLPIKQQGSDSLVVETTDTNGNAISGARVYVKGGYKKYTATTDTSYYFDNLSPDTRPTTDAGGLASLSNLVPGQYIFCGDNAHTSCTNGVTNYYLAAAVPYGGSNSFNPVNVPIYDPANPPAQTFAYGGGNFLQKVRLMLTTSATFPRIASISPYEASQGSGALSSFSFQISGANLPCSSTAASCATTVQLHQGGNTFPASCTGDATGVQLNCTANLATASLGVLSLSVTSSGQTLNIPASPLLGGLNVAP